MAMSEATLIAGTGAALAGSAAIYWWYRLRKRPDQVPKTPPKV